MKPYLIGIAGPSCAGKSYLSTHLARHLNAVMLNLDSYYAELNHLSPGQRAHFNFDAPESLDSPLLIEHVRQLSHGEAIEKPIYNFKNHSRTGRTERLEAREFIIIEGLFALYWEEIRAVQATKVFVDLGEEICLARRIERDIRERGRTRESVLEQFQSTVQPMAQRYVHPTRQFADVVLTGDGAIADEMERVLKHIKNGSSRGSGT
jgi:uridine kinase